MTATIEVPQSLFDMPGVALGDASLEIEERLDFKTWESIGTLLKKIPNASPWWLGDWMLHGRQSYGESYAQAIETSKKTGLKVKRLQNYMWIAEAYPKSTRVDSVSWSHHRHVAKLPVKVRTAWLQKARKEDWDRNEMVTKIKEAEHPPIVADADAGDYLDPNYKLFLLELEAALSAFLNRCPYEPFKPKIEKMKHDVGYERKRSIVSDYESTRDEVDKMACTVEEIQDEVPLTLRELVKICEMIVEREPTTYEFRPVGCNTIYARGGRAHGIFRRDAPYLDDYTIPKVAPNVYSMGERE